MKDIKLPNKPSALLRLAVNDCKKVQKMKTRKLQMLSWHHWSSIDNVCSVCMAGSIMDRTLKVDLKRNIIPADFDFDKQNKLHAVNEMRNGNFDSAFSLLDMKDKYNYKINQISSFVSRNFCFFKNRAPWNIYLKAADMLEALGC